MTDSAAPTGLLASARALAGTLVAIAGNRLSLLALELEDERARLLSLLLYGIAAVLALGAGLVFLAVLVTVLLWDNNRGLALGIFAALFIGVGTVCALVARSLARAPSALFSASVAELAKDREALRS